LPYDKEKEKLLKSANKSPSDCFRKMARSAPYNNSSEFSRKKSF